MRVELLAVALQITGICILLTVFQPNSVVLVSVSFAASRPQVLDVIKCFVRTVALIGTNKSVNWEQRTLMERTPVVQQRVSQTRHVVNKIHACAAIVRRIVVEKAMNLYLG